ncbi:leucine-rich repeat-containing protein 3C [Cervus elaphus]|uniref:leucine-rich repeat-containing protein 3C n=1 Tax=Cervus elaphus TaxID=9860 RepID=UPI001CC3099A|nr:leucine-rich repeat-containing protein 3C [Cervus elaphus]
MQPGTSHLEPGLVRSPTPTRSPSWKRPNLYPRSPASPRPHPQPKRFSSTPHPLPPAPTFPFGHHFDRCTPAPGRCTPATSTRPVPIPSNPGASPTAPTSFPDPPVAPGYSRLGHSTAARLDSPCGAGGRGPGRVPGGGGRCCSSSCNEPRRQPPRWQLGPNQRPAPAPITSPPSAGPPAASWELNSDPKSEFFNYTSLPPDNSPDNYWLCPCRASWKRVFRDIVAHQAPLSKDFSRFYSSPRLCQSVAMFPPASHLLSLLLVIDAGGTVPSPQGVPQGCYAAEEAGERTFRCSQAGLSAVPTSIPNDTRKLYLDANRLVSVPAGAFRHLPVLEELDLSHNILAHLSGAAFQGLAGTLRRLDLSANQLASVPVEAFVGLKIQVNLSANPWRCDCALQEVLRRVRLAPGTGTGIVCGPGARPDLVGQEFLPLVGEEELCGTGRGGAQRSTDVALLVTMGGWLVLVVAYLAHYVWQNRDETRRPLKRAPVLPVRSEDSSTLSTMV